MKTFKEKLLLLCRNMLEEKIKGLRLLMEEMGQSMENETKSSAGDKHETARAKMQAEQEKLGSQLKELEIQSANLNKGDKKLIYTNHGVFLIAVALGKIELDKKTVFVISPMSPLGKKLIESKAGDEVKVNDLSYQILESY